MIYKFAYKTPEGFSDMIMNSDGEYLTGLWFEGSRDTLKHTLDFLFQREVQIYEKM